eukprot:TRINITY_DN26248_c0_g1_i1.p1 TRINITY_DN26248_c0_g1~~TRINITY_DN26248_c0_g1_i1.p1  ORF type:complete len:165 (+),score=30.03 TRINITY_DN26248_c0_g1_i1:61-495(+)
MCIRDRNRNKVVYRRIFDQVAWYKSVELPVDYTPLWITLGKTFHQYLQTFWLFCQTGLSSLLVVVFVGYGTYRKFKKRRKLRENREVDGRNVLRELRDLGYAGNPSNNIKAQGGSDVKKRHTPRKKPDDSYLVADKDVSLDFNL